MEMFGWDSDKDGIVDVHARNIANSVNLANTIVDVSEDYDLPLKPIIVNPGTGASDHGSFWKQGFGALTFSQAFNNLRDFTPHYHKATDRFQHFNMSYFHNLAKLGVGTIASLAIIDGLISNNEELLGFNSSFDIHSYPNPAVNNVTVAYSIPSNDLVKISLVNSLSQERIVLLDDLISKGIHEFTINTEEFNRGSYVLIIESEQGIKSEHIVLMN